MDAPGRALANFQEEWRKEPPNWCARYRVADPAAESSYDLGAAISEQLRSIPALPKVRAVQDSAC